MSATETYKMLKQVHGSDTLRRKQTFEWHRRFRAIRESVEDDGRPQTSHNAENSEKVSAVVRKKRHQTLGQMAESVEISEATCECILVKDHNMHRVY
ncbi:uncharacterized protein TNCV_4521611 [Trichonephila clavipes]|nr:uncharacterized protein TNCV_4521611 [Trichonephila clavipes]